MQACKTLVLLGLLIFSGPSYSQPLWGVFKKVELGIHAGPLFFLGDLGGNLGKGTQFIKDINWEETKLGMGVQFNYYPANWISVRTAFHHGTVSGNDRHSPNITSNDIFRFNRNLHFRSRINELYAGLDFFPFQTIPTKRATVFDLVQPFTFIGAGIFHFNPQAKDIDQIWVPLHPLKLEGQGFSEYPSSKPYQLTQFNLLAGVGIKYYINASTYVGIELLYRKLFTDQVDNVSVYYYVDPSTFDLYLNPSNAARAKRLYYQGNYNLGGQLPYQANLPRGNPDQNDAYFGQAIHFGMKIFPQRDKRFRCPESY